MAEKTKKRKEIKKSKKKWIQAAVSKNPGALREELGVTGSETIPAGKLARAAKKPGKTGKRARLAIMLKKFSKSKKGK